CEAHHETLPWSRGGKTNLADGVLLCGHHHRLAHHTNYDHQRLPNGDIRFTRRT
ncbi:MAG: endonuclease, partial [Marmoricola sp.]|nr:endonuclease [Marmoricola sp.]MCW2783183.1 endonuclease [Marmoricola sp.]